LAQGSVLELFEVLVQGFLLNDSNLNNLLDSLRQSLVIVENKIAKLYVQNSFEKFLLFIITYYYYFFFY